LANKKWGKQKKQRHLGFYMTAAFFGLSYVYISSQTDSMWFWNWRKLNFKDFELVDSHQDYGTLHKNESLDGKPIVVKGDVYYSGLATHANSEIRIKLKQDSSFFAGKCAYPDSAFGANIQCEIKTPSKVLFTSQTLNNDNREQSFQIFLNGEKNLTLGVKTLKKDITAAHAVWVDLKTKN
jgi:hypothetical protein